MCPDRVAGDVPDAARERIMHARGLAQALAGLTHPELHRIRDLGAKIDRLLDLPASPALDAGKTETIHHGEAAPPVDVLTPEEAQAVLDEIDFAYREAMGVHTMTDVERSAHAKLCSLADRAKPGPTQVGSDVDDPSLGARTWTAKRGEVTLTLTLEEAQAIYDQLTEHEHPFASEAPALFNGFWALRSALEGKERE